MIKFAKYEEMRSSGSTPDQVYSLAKQDGLDNITSIRMLRQVFGLSLADAKRAMGAGNWFESKQAVRVGSKVYWDGFEPINGSFLMEACVVSIKGQMVFLDQLRRFRPIESELIEVELDGTELREMRRDYLERSLAERLRGWEGHLDDIFEVAR